jgi:hypothetical protein
MFFLNRTIVEGSFMSLNSIFQDTTLFRTSDKDALINGDRDGPGISYLIVKMIMIMWHPCVVSALTHTLSDDVIVHMISNRFPPDHA